MEKQNNITTAANSKIMNAVENTKLFAAAAESEKVIVSSEADNEPGKQTRLGQQKTMAKRNRKNKLD
ncbi:MAG: hypothetical protein ABIS01_13050 [Ferruginibacter sp.]